MTVISTEKNPETLSFTIVCQFDATVEEVWQLWADPRKLERWWGPPGYAAAFLRHDFTVPGKSIYHMPGPDGEPAYCFWHFLRIDEPRGLEVLNGFGDRDGEPAGPIPPCRIEARIEAADGGTRLTTISRFDSLATLEKMDEFGMAEGMSQAMGQMDGILTEG